MVRYAVVLAGAGLGGLMRYVFSTWIMTRTGGRFPWGTLIVNVTGSFLIGLLMTWLTERGQPHPYWRLFLVVGVLGGYTTFSSLEYEALQLSRWMAPAYVLASVVAGYAAVWLGMEVARR